MSFTAAVIGCGRIGSRYDEREDATADPRSHAGAYAASSAFVLVAGVDPLPDQRDAFERRWRIPAYASVDEMLEHVRPEVWSICTPAEPRVAIGKRAIAAGARVLWCEKPLAPSSADAADLTEVARSHGVPLAVNYLRRWDRAHAQAATWVRAGGLGTFQHGVVHYARGLRNYGTHAIDLLRWFVGEPTWVCARQGWDRDVADASPVFIMEIEGGSVAFLPVQRAAYDLFEIDLFGSKGRLTIEDSGRSIVLRTVGPDPEFRESRALTARTSPFSPGLRGTMIAAAANVGAAINGTPLRCTGEDGIAALRIAEAIERAIATGHSVYLPVGASL